MKSLYDQSKIVLLAVYALKVLEQDYPIVKVTKKELRDILKWENWQIEAGQELLEEEGVIKRISRGLWGVWIGRGY